MLFNSRKQGRLICLTIDKIYLQLLRKFAANCSGGIVKKIDMCLFLPKINKIYTIDMCFSHAHRKREREGEREKSLPVTKIRLNS